MKTLDWKTICTIVLVIALAAVLATAYVGVERITVLSDTCLASLRGGATYCCETSSKCKCDTNNCSDIECSWCSCYYDGKWNDGGCEGNADDTDEVTTCYKTTTQSDSCTWGSALLSECKGDFWKGDQSCDGSPTKENVGLHGTNCS